MRKRPKSGGEPVNASAHVPDGITPPGGGSNGHKAGIEGDMVLLGRIVAAQGLSGEVKILTFTETPDNIAAYGPLTASDGRTFRIVGLRPQKGEAVVARLAGVGDRTAAEALRGVDLYIPSELLPTPDDGEWYYRDLIGLKAVSPEGAEIGEVISVQNFGAGDLLEIRLPDVRQTAFVAFTLALVPTVDIKGGHVVVVMPEEEIAGPEDEGAANSKS